MKAIPSSAPKSAYWTSYRREGRPATKVVILFAGGERHEILHIPGLSWAEARQWAVVSARLIRQNFHIN